MKFTTFSFVLLAAAPAALANPRPKQDNQTPAFDKRELEILEQRQVTKTNTNDTPNHTSSASVGGPGPADGLTPCILDCVKAAAQDAQCPSYLDLSCICTSAPFLSSASSCLKSKCTAAEQQQALALQAQQFGSVTLTSSAGGTIISTPGGASSTPTAPSGSITGSVTTQGTEPTGGSPTATNSGPAQTTSNAARALGGAGYGGVEFGKWIVVSLGVVAGALVVA